MQPFQLHLPLRQLTVLSVNGTTLLCVDDVERAIEEFPDVKCYRGTLYRF